MYHLCYGWSLRHSSLVMRDLPRLLYPLTFFSLRQVGGREPGSSQDVTLPLIPDENREINQHLYAVGFCRKPVSQWGPNQKSQGHSADDTKLVTKNGRPSMIAGSAAMWQRLWGYMLPAHCFATVGCGIGSCVLLRGEQSGSRCRRCQLSSWMCPT